MSARGMDVCSRWAVEDGTVCHLLCGRPAEHVVLDGEHGPLPVCRWCWDADCSAPNNNEEARPAAR